MLARGSGLANKTGVNRLQQRVQVALLPHLSRTGIRTMAIATTATPTTSTDIKQQYDKVCEKLKEVSALNGISGLLGWDELVMMPSGAAESRGHQKSVLAGVMYDKRADAELGKLLQSLHDAIASGAEGAAALDPVARANIRDAYKSYKRTVAIPKELAQRMAKLESDGYHAWVEARKASDWSKFAPYLQQWLDCNKEKARCIDPNTDPYDVLLEDYEKGMKSTRLDEIFKQARDGLVPLIAAVKAKGVDTISNKCLKGSFDLDKQAALCKQVALDLGFSLDHGRLDVSVHPFTGGCHPTDVRMTTRFMADDVVEGLTGAIHETGHALYEQGRNKEYDGLPVSDPLSVGFHESQSLCWERMVGLSRPFATYLLPKLKEFFPEHFANLTEEQLYQANNVVIEPSFIRVAADELQYPLHVILRYEIERGLTDGSIKVEDVPKVWNEKMKAYMGAVPPDDAQGCLQDVHWSAGAFAYFPTYTLGAMFAVQLFNAAKEQIPGLEESLAKGEFNKLRSWLAEKVHKVGSLPASSDELLQQITGKPLDPEVYVSYLKEKYSKLYGL